MILLEHRNFHQGYQNDVILELLGVYHNIAISLSTFKASRVKLTGVDLSATDPGLQSYVAPSSIRIPFARAETPSRTDC